jgi:hypothetical protein
MPRRPVPAKNRSAPDTSLISTGPYAARPPKATAGANTPNGKAMDRRPRIAAGQESPNEPEPWNQCSTRASQRTIIATCAAQRGNSRSTRGTFRIRKLRNGRRGRTYRILTDGQTAHKDRPLEIEWFLAIRQTGSARSRRDCCWGPRRWYSSADTLAGCRGTIGTWE